MRKSYKYIDVGPRPDFESRALLNGRAFLIFRKGPHDTAEWCAESIVGDRPIPTEDLDFGDITRILCVGLTSAANGGEQPYAIDVTALVRAELLEWIEDGGINEFDGVDWARPVPDFVRQEAMDLLRESDEVSARYDPDIGETFLSIVRMAVQ